MNCVNIEKLLEEIDVLLNQLHAVGDAYDVVAVTKDARVRKFLRQADKTFGSIVAELRIAVDKLATLLVRSSLEGRKPPFSPALERMKWRWISIRQGAETAQIRA